MLRGGAGCPVASFVAFVALIGALAYSWSTLLQLFH
jgi:hypothetical protein